MRKNIIIILFILLACRGYASVQTISTSPHEKLEQAIALIDQGAYDRAIALIDEAEVLDPGSYAYPYEKARAYYLKDDYTTSLEFLKKSLRCKDVTDLPYILTGKIYDIMGRPQRALDTFLNGLEKFPRSGALYFESGLVYMHQSDYDGALDQYKQGIDADPYFPSNYYHTAYIYLNSGNRAMGIVYGETFLNLETDSKRSSAMSKMLYDAYVNIYALSDPAKVPEFPYQSITLYGDASEPAIPFFLAYELALWGACAEERRDMNISSLGDIRSRFLDIWFSNDPGLYLSYFAPLFDYQRVIRESGHFDAYNYWLLADGDPDSFRRWQTDNEEKYDAFIKWFNENPITLE